MTNQIELIDWTKRGTNLLQKAKKILSEAANERMKALSVNIPDKVIGEGNEVAIAFAGQYSAGKSTLIKALTGRNDIATGAAITTELAGSYEWEGIRIIDTPGVHTEVRPDHDVITYKAIAESDLLVFVVTNELFDSHLAMHFRKLAIDHEKAHEMMLVVNKMQRCAKGNSKEAQEIIKEDLKMVLEPYSPDDLRVCYLDAQFAIESKEETDVELSKALLRKSGFNNFIYELNVFVREKGLTAKYTTALYTLEQILQESLSAETSGDTDVDGLEEILLQKRRAILDASDRLPKSVESSINETGELIRKEGRRIADMINVGADNNEVNDKLEKAQVQVNNYCSNLSKKVQEVIADNMEGLESRIVGISSSELAKKLLERLSYKLSAANISPDTLNKMKKATDISSQLGSFLVKYSFNPNAAGIGGLMKLGQYSGTSAHSAIKTIGNFFGKSFKPWEAVKWGRLLANAGRILSIAGSFLSIIFLIKEESDAKKLEQEMREGRNAIRTGFNDAAYEIELNFNKTTGEYVAQTLTVEIAEVDKQLAELRDIRANKSKTYGQLIALYEETKLLIKDIHGAST